jgi:hypothetical protein
MDPNTCLTELRALLAANVDREFVSDDATARIIELTMALDEWITRGGFLPSAWNVR